MKNITAALMVLLAQVVFAQTESFDIIHYTAPKDWTKETKEGLTSFTMVDENTGKFCVIVLFASAPSKGGVEKDFASEWRELAVKPHQADPAPQTEKQIAGGGWKVMTGASPIKLEGLDCYIVLTVFSGFNRRVSVLASLNDSSYLSEIDALLANMKLDKKPAASKPKAVPKTTTQPDLSKHAATVTPATEKNPETVKQDNTSLESFGHMRFEPIKGWTMQRYANAIIFKPEALADNRYIETRILESRPFSGSLQEAFAASWKEALEQLKLVSPYTRPYDIITERTSFKGWEYIQGHGTVKRMNDPNDLGYDKYYINLFVIKLNNRIERIVTGGSQNINGADFSLYNSSIYSDPILGLCYSVHFDDWKEPAIGGLKGEEISGMYEGLKLSGGGLTGSYALFFPNGQVFFGEKFPTEGFEGKNTWVYAELNTRNWGTYTVHNGKGTINMGYGNIPLKVVGDDLVIRTQNTDHTYERLPSLDGAVISGTYAFDGDWGRKPPSITFTTDGKFMDEGALNILNHQTTSPDEFNITAKPGSGTYEIKNYTIVFRYTDGRKVQIVFTGNGFDRKNPGPATLTLSFNNDILYKK
jgi:hypothetical protein